MRSRTRAAAAALLCACSLLTAQTRPDGARALSHVAFLASDENGGRKSGTDGYLAAARYVAEQMRSFGLKPGVGDSSYFQTVPLPNWTSFTAPARLEITAPVSLSYIPGQDRDFLPLAGTGSGIVQGQAVFAGFGLVSDSCGWNDYAGLDAAGKIVIVVPDAPDSLTCLTPAERSVEAKIQNAVRAGASGMLFIQTTRRLSWGRGRSGGHSFQPPPGFIIMSASRQVCDDIFYEAGQSWRWLVSRTLRELTSHTCDLPVTLEMEAHFQQSDSEAPNVIGVLPGRDKRLKHEYIIVGGHLDHLGTGMRGEIYHGADDNAGSAGIMLEIARVLQSDRFRPRRTVVFASWAGEEIGLRGSRYYAEHPLFPLEKTAVYLNIDMVGSGDMDLTTGGIWEFSQLFDIVRRDMPDELKSNIRYRLDYGGSDHAAFLRKRVKSLSLRTGDPLNGRLDDEHPEYHRPGDNLKIMSAAILEHAAVYYLHIIRGFADTDENLMDPALLTEHIHKNAFVADLHCDTIGRLLAGDDLAADNDHGHIDIPKLDRGAVDLQVFACYVGPPHNETERLNAAVTAFRQIDAVHELVDGNPDRMLLIEKSADLEKLRGVRKTGALIGIEGGYAIENDLRLLRSFYRSGVRLMTLTHWTRTDWADASGDEEPLFNGLTDFGESVVREMNRLGMIVDVSHAHDSTFWDVLRVSKAPVVASHSCCRALSEHHRNLSDEMLKALADNGGVIGINFCLPFLDSRISADPSLVVDVATVADHIEHVISVTGSSRHVALGSDYDGISEAPAGLEDIGRIQAVTDELYRRGMDPSDIRNILGANVLRVFSEVERVSSSLRTKTDT
ncbi:M20/M25/M40 family metallo-hydrolase [bacterium]|nr:M20/M25/M40 family metallo-hydrolase [bacterium]